MIKVIYGLSIFLSAMLLFFIQPLVAKVMLPFFGGSAFVWMTTILFFQTVLLLGYCYAYVIAKYLTPKKQALCHLLLLGLSLFFMPFALNYELSLQTLWPPWAVLRVLTSSVLIPCIVICASSPLLQHWYCQVKFTTFPYVFYAVSNAGSLLGLLGYPFLVEPLVGLKDQKMGWSWFYGLYLLLCFFCLSKLFTVKKFEPLKIDVKNINLKQQFMWLLLTFTSSALLLSVTQFLVQNVINLPLLWVLPLALYLISYIVTFSKSKNYDREFWFGAFIVWLLLFLLLFHKSHLAGIDAVSVVLMLLYTGCMVCHGELIKRKPPSQDLTLFYLFIALGGVLGGVFSNIIALLFFVRWWDLYVPLLLINGMIIAFLFLQCFGSKNRWNKILQGISVVSGLVLVAVIGINNYFPPQKVVAQFRNPYGMIKVLDYNHTPNGFRALRHGMVIHGLQFKNPTKAQLPNTYYGATSGVGLAFEFLRQKSNKPLAIGTIGLGCGTLATYAKHNEMFIFYEIDKDIENIALNYFTFLKQSGATIQIQIGDGRMMLQRDHGFLEKFDMLIVDAFSGDVIPAHLLTKEAMMLYKERLLPNGIMAFHTSNTYLDFLPVTLALAKELGCGHYWIESDKNVSKGLYKTTWALISCDATLKPWLLKRGIALADTTHITPKLWTDDLNTILPLLKFG